MNHKTILSSLTILFMTALLFSCGNGLKRHKLEVIIASDGSGTGSFSQSPKSIWKYKEGTEITLSAVANAGSFFFGWYDAPQGGNVVSRESEYRFRLTGETTLYPRFENDEITFADPRLERCVRSTISKGKGKLTYKDVAGIKSLDWNGCNENLKGLEYLTALESLILEHRELTDISPIKNLTNIKDLSIKETKVTDIRALANLINITKLSLKQEGITDINSLAKLVNIRELSLHSKGISDIKALANLTKITRLDLYCEGVTDLRALSALTNITKLNLSCERTTDISPLANLVNIKELSLYGEGITDITPLANLTELEMLELDDTRLKEITPLAKLTNLQDLTIIDQKLTEITALANLTELTRVILSGDRIADITPLTNLPNIGAIILEGKGIRELSPMAKADLPKLECLLIECSELTDVRGLINYPKIADIYISIDEENKIPESQLIELSERCKGLDFGSQWYSL